METPRNDATTTVPRSTFCRRRRLRRRASSVIFSGRTPTRTASVPCGPIRSAGTCSVAPSWVSTVASGRSCAARSCASTGSRRRGSWRRTRCAGARRARRRRRPARSGPSFITAIVSAMRHGLLLIVRHVHERDADVLLDALELDLQLLAQAQVERAERLVEQQRARPVDQRAGERDALLLAAGELRRLALAAGRRAGPSRAPRRRAAGPRPWRPSCARGRTTTFFSTVRCGNSA